MHRSTSVLTFACAISFAIGAVRSPDDRRPLDPKSVASYARPASVPVSVESLFYTRTVADPAWSPDGKEISFTCNLTGRLNLWKVSSTGGWPIQLTASNDRQFGNVWSPDGRWILYEQDFGGGEIYDLFAIPSTGGEPQNLTNSPDISETGARWSPDGRTVAFYLPSEVFLQHRPCSPRLAYSFKPQVNKRTRQNAAMGYSTLEPRWKNTLRVTRERRLHGC
jgi:Tol biopolymer transport system component